MNAVGRNLIALAAGGTGGHMFPAAAVAGELRARGHDVALITDRRGGAFGDMPGPIQTYGIRAGGVMSGGLLRRLTGLVALAVGTLQAERLLSRLGPAVAVGFGGYASAPTMLAATRRGIATVIHEQNAVLGRANRLLARRVTRIATSFETVTGLKPRDRAKARRTGNPVRPQITALGARPYPAPDQHGPLALLVVGGSQGASVFSRVVPKAVARLTEGWAGRLSISQQCRPEDLAEVERAYAAAGVRADLAPFFDDMPARLEAAHLLICRAGASTVAELAAAGRPAILVPYPHAADDHQTANARAMERGGGAWLMPESDFTVEALAVLLESLLTAPRTLDQAASQARAAGRADAAARLAELVTELLPSNGEGTRTASAGTAGARPAAPTAINRERAA